MRLRSIYFSIALATALPTLASAQPFSITAQTGTISSAVAPGGTVNVSANAIGQATTIRVTISYRGASSATVTGVDRVGSSDYTSTPINIPMQLQPGNSLVAGLTYTPTTGQPAPAQLVISYLEGSSTTPSSFTININGTAPDLVHTYLLSGGNAQAVTDGATIQFPTTTVDTTRSATFTILNRGSGPGTIASILLSGTAFQLGGLQVPPYTIPSNGSLSFLVTFAPTNRASQTGKLVINFAGRDHTFNLQGTGTSADYAYTVLRADNSTTNFQPNETVEFPNTNVGSSSSVTIRILNRGNSAGVINSISVLGNGYQLTALPFFPLTIPVGGQATFGLTFAPQSPGTLPGALKIGDDTFSLAGSGIGSQLTYAFSITGAANTVTPGGIIQFSPSRIGESGLVRFSVTNAGNSSAPINTIFLTGSNAFTLQSLPPLPLTLDAGESTSFNIRFAPTVVGVSQSALNVGSATFSVSGSASAPEPLPSIDFTGRSGDIQPLQQPSYTIKLRQPYAIDVIGTLNLSFSSGSFSNDPTVQFATGGRTADFYIPAGTLDALFANNRPQIAIQTGTVAGTITLTPAFAIAGGLDITPSNVPVVNLTIPPAAPQITTLSIASQSASGFNLIITGYATSRSVNQIQLQVTAASGQTITNSTLTAPVESTFQAWYQSTASQTSGSAFTATFPITMTGNSAAPTTLTRAIQSISVTLSNAQGSSSSQSVTMP